jgi:hypothetical protein
MVNCGKTPESREIHFGRKTVEIFGRIVVFLVSSLKLQMMRSKNSKNSFYFKRILFFCPNFHCFVFVGKFFDLERISSRMWKTVIHRGKTEAICYKNK